MSGPLKGLVVIEMAARGPVPLAGQLLADLGAQVTIIDRQSAKLDHTDINRRNKKTVALNLKHRSGLAAVRKMLSTADIILEGFRPGVMEKLGLGSAQLHALNERLIIGRMTGWGQTGPLSQSAGHDINYLALTGALHAIGHRGQPPVPPLNLAADYGGGSMFLVMGVLSALFERAQSGLGQVVDTAMVDGVPAMMGLIHTLYAQGSWLNERQSNMLDGGAPYYRCYETSDKKYVALGAIEPQFFSQFLKLSGLPESDLLIQNDPDQWPDMHRRYSALFKTGTRDHWDKLFADTDACVSPVLDFTEVSNHMHNRQRQVFTKRNNVLQASPAPRFDRTPAATPQSSQAAGADTIDVLMEHGYSEDEIATMRTAGALT